MRTKGEELKMTSTIPQNNGVLFANVADSWKQKMKNSALSSKTIRMYEYVLDNKIMPKFRNYRLKDISRHDCENLIDFYKATALSESVLRAIWRVISEILKSAHEANLLPEKNNWPFPKLLDYLENIPESSLSKLEKAIHENDASALMSVMLREDVPMSNLLALSKNDVDEYSGTITIKNKMVFTKNNFDIKPELNIQTIVISSESMRILKNEIQKHEAFEKKSKGNIDIYNNSLNLIFAGKKGVIQKPSYYIFKFGQLSHSVGFRVTPKMLYEFKYKENDENLPRNYAEKVVKSKGKTYHYFKTFVNTAFGRKEICARSIEELSRKYKMRNNRYAYRLTKNSTLFSEHCRKELSEMKQLSDKEKEKISVLLQKYLDPFSANYTVNQIDDEFQGKFIKYLDLQKCTYRMQEKITGFLRNVCMAAMNKNYIRYNPFCDVYLKPDKPVKYHALSEEEIEKIMKLDSNNINNAFLQVKLLTGLRTAEALGLRWSDISDDRKHMFISSQILSRNEPTLINRTKNYRPRTITPPSLTFDILDKYRNKTAKNVNNAMNLVFCNENGTPLNPGLLHKKLKDIIGRKNVRLHDLRVTAITVIYNKTGDLALASKEAGHMNKDVTVKHYVDYEPDLTLAKETQDKVYSKIVAL